MGCVSGAVPAWAHEMPEIHPHDPTLLLAGETECVRLAEVLAPWLADGVEHVGSTAVAGLAAKPIIDLMASVRDLDEVVGQASDGLAADGWCYVPPELDQRPWRRFFVKPDQSRQRRVAHLHVIQAGHPRWAEQLAFRDALRGDEQLARQYGDLKRLLAGRYADDREAYTAAKAEFVANALAGHAGEPPALPLRRYPGKPGASAGHRPTEPIQ